MINKKSKQRDAILASLKGRTDHPTADMIYESVRHEIPNISLGTVYRNLALLTEQGDILKLPSANGPDRYDGDILPHYHFICDCCNNVFDMPGDFGPEISRLADKHAPGKITRHMAYFYGVCSSCEAK